MAEKRTIVLNSGGAAVLHKYYSFNIALVDYCLSYNAVFAYGISMVAKRWCSVILVYVRLFVRTTKNARAN